MLWAKLLVIGFIFVIAYNLFRGLYFLVSRKGDRKAVVRSLSYRIGFSMLLFMLLVILYATGLLHPHAL